MTPEFTVFPLSLLCFNLDETGSPRLQEQLLNFLLAEAVSRFIPSASRHADSPSSLQCLQQGWLLETFEQNLKPCVCLILDLRPSRRSCCVTERNHLSWMGHHDLLRASPGPGRLKQHMGGELLASTLYSFLHCDSISRPVGISSITAYNATTFQIDSRIDLCRCITLGVKRWGLPNTLSLQHKQLKEESNRLYQEEGSTPHIVSFLAKPKSIFILSELLLSGKDGGGVSVSTSGLPLGSSQALST